MIPMDKPTLTVAEASNDFQKAAELAVADGEVYILQDGKPKYKLIDLDQDTTIEMTDDEKIDFVAARVFQKYRRAFEELAK